MKYFIVGLITILFLGCKTQEKPISYMLLEKHSGKTPISYGDNGYIYRERLFW